MSLFGKSPESPERSLGWWRDLTARLLGSDSPAVKFLEAKIAEQGPHMEVVADEGQVTYLLQRIHNDEAHGRVNDPAAMLNEALSGKAKIT